MADPFESAHALILLIEQRCGKVAADLFLYIVMGALAAASINAICQYVVVPAYKIILLANSFLTGKKIKPPETIDDLLPYITTAAILVSVLSYAIFYVYTRSVSKRIDARISTVGGEVKSAVQKGLSIKAEMDEIATQLADRERFMTVELGQMLTAYERVLAKNEALKRKHIEDPSGSGESAGCRPG
jgi:hypothetical protein